MAAWSSLTEITQGARLVVERVRLPEKGLAVEGEFELPPLAQLTLDDQVFVASFVKSHGSIKEMERLFGVSYPTIKNRLNRVAEILGGGGEMAVDTDPAPSASEVLDRLERGEITAAEAKEALRK